MDLETENRIAAILLKEAAELRRQAQTEGALSYLRQPTVRSRPNSRFLTATVLGVQQANRVVEVNEMWRLREKQLELDNRIRGKRHESTSGRGHGDTFGSQRSSNSGRSEVEPNASSSRSSRARTNHDQIPTEGEGLRDDEVDEFLQSRTKRGRGAVGSRMDETGPYLSSSSDSKRNTHPDEELGKPRVLLGPEKPISLAYLESSDDEYLQGKKGKVKKMSLGKHPSKKHKLREESKVKKKKTRIDEKKRKHRR
ncbi:hypothetical protein F511_12891 [Dorcoceras hygrometricum]|uniref:Uncharacterized protein n=1 Tax=Dorcoceras hygrometricum TaxID=472368 RepID=A0A2Z7CVK4_9LAMI|nr:hypothetical protein F511_12891 [Dorcoceras hygrometricum]